jgi:hypothetical protein
MKTRTIFYGLLSVISITFFTASCSKDSQAVTEVTSLDLISESKSAAETDKTTDDVLNILEIAYSEIEEEGGRTASLFPECVTITITAQNEIIYVTLDFGQGCELANGNVVSGKIYISYGPVQNGTRTINYEFDTFVFNEKGIEGGGTIFRERFNDAGNPQSTVHKNLRINFPNGVTATANGVRVAEWVEGTGSGTWRDNVFMITGNRAIVFSSGFTHEAIVTEALRRESTCRYFVSGLVEINRNGTNGILNYGDGVCDNLAILTVDGVDHTIILP